MDKIRLQKDAIILLSAAGVPSELLQVWRMVPLILAPSQSFTPAWLKERNQKALGLFSGVAGIQYVANEIEAEHGWFAAVVTVSHEAVHAIRYMTGRYTRFSVGSIIEAQEDLIADVLLLRGIAKCKGENWAEKERMKAQRTIQKRIQLYLRRFPQLNARGVTPPRFTSVIYL